ncbi:hypothetical protein B0H14DRAFT_2569313 [Mycena olivaceomarginata]|nr:hypothetical protein B0H14DRAFT_2569313 [Mycena olivaceomarginata]
MSSRASTPVSDDDDFRSTMNAMAQSSPAAPAPTQKRNHGTMAGDNDDSNSDNEQRAQQATELELFVNLIRNKEPAPLREVKLLANLFAFGNELGKLVASKPGFEVSSDLNTNIVKYAPAVLLSSKITIYKAMGLQTFSYWLMATWIFQPVSEFPLTIPGFIIIGLFADVGMGVGYDINAKGKFLARNNIGWSHMKAKLDISSP